MTLARALTGLAVAAVVAACGDETDPTPQPPPPEAEATWQLVTERWPEALLSVHGTSSRDVWAVGADKGRGPLVLHWDGSAWSQRRTGTSGDLWWVHAFADGPVFFGGQGQTLVYADGAFRRVENPGVGREVVYGLWGSSPERVFAVGSIAGRAGFIWRWDGQRFVNVALPDDMPRREADGELPGLFKVWGEGDEVFVVGSEGVVLRAQGDGAFRVVRSAPRESLFTVHGGGGTVVAVGGNPQGVLLEGSLSDASSWVNRGPANLPLIQGVCLAPDGRGFAAGAGGAVLQRTSEGWVRVRHGLPISNIESLHAVWIDPDGGMWSVGGNVLTSALDQGVIIRFGADAGRATAEPLPEPQPAVCPPDKIDIAPGRSIVRRWNDQILNAIRRDLPRPGVHARTLFHASAAAWDAWAAFDPDAGSVLVSEKATADDVNAAREIAISHAMYKIAKHRYQLVGGPVSQACFDAFFARLGLNPADVNRLQGDDPAALGNRIGAAYIELGLTDGANEQIVEVDGVRRNYLDPNPWTPVNPPLVVDQPGTSGIVDPSVWQEINLATAITQNGLPTGAGVQRYVHPHWGGVMPFALERPSEAAAYLDPGPFPVWGAQMREEGMELVRLSSQLDPANPVTVDASPGGTGNNSLGADDGEGHALNPITGAPYPPQIKKRADFYRVISEYWIGGPASETPPGHWNTMYNELSDRPDFVRRWKGEGPVLSDLDFDVRAYLAINGAVHDAAIGCWEIKRRGLGARPLSIVRHMAELGQSSDPSAPNYHPDGMPLEPGVTELITDESSRPGQRHAHLRPYVGEVAVFGWRGEPADPTTQVSGVGWLRAKEWITYQRRGFVTPAFPGFTSGHSTFSRAAAEVFARMTGSEYFPGGLGEFVARPGYLKNEYGPSEEIRLQWATYYDAADQAGQSRRYGGIHIKADDHGGRRTGSFVGINAFERADEIVSGR